jgi:hypothetical protein
MFRTLIFIRIYPVFLMVFSRKDKTIITNGQNISMHNVDSVWLNEHNDFNILNILPVVY